MKEAASRGAFARFYRVFRWVVLASLVVVILLVLRRSPPPRVDTDPEAKATLETKLTEMQQARQAGQPYTLRMQEAEINSWMGSNLALAPPQQPQPAGAATPATPAPAADPSIEEVRSTVRDVKIDLLEDRLRAYVVFDFHGQDLSLLLEGRLSARGGYLRFEPTGGKLGSLPLPQAALDRAVARLFDSPENQDKFRLPSEINDIRVENHQLVVSYK